MTSTVSNARNAWLEEMARTGRLLAEAKAAAPSWRYHRFLRQQGIAIQEAADSITLYENLDRARQAEMWNRHCGGATPHSVREMVLLLAAWRSRLN